MPSSVIKYFSYEEEKQVLFITFVSGITYVYKAVPVGVVNGLHTAASKGRFFNRYIKGHFNYKKLRTKKAF
uniref:KTSC domain-containing protein n=1 Tax=Pedobacter schmidteae TaxID=2201271 RepID=UPI000EB58914|nr:KTSC domain-containing protein [Pedobacter schmidteae]